LTLIRRVLLFLVCLAAISRADVNPQQLIQQGRADEARRALGAQIQQNPKDAEAYHLLCRLYYQLEQWDKALKMAEKAVSLEPGNSVYHQWLGRAAGRKAENSNPFTAFMLARRVHAEFERAVALDGNNLSARTDLAEYYMEAPGFLGGDKNKSRRQADIVGRHDPALASYIRAQVEESQGNARAEEEYKKAIQESGNGAHYWIELAYYYRRAGRLQEMEEAITHSLTASRKTNLPEYDAAYLLLRTERSLSIAAKILRRYLASESLSEDGPAFHAHFMLGELMEKQGDRKGAAAEFRAALALASDYRAAQDALARVSR
jgi:tetratricopeptide (TPR) repeat protein